MKPSQLPGGAASVLPEVKVTHTVGGTQAGPQAYVRIHREENVGREFQV